MDMHFGSCSVLNGYKGESYKGLLETIFSLKKRWAKGIQYIKNVAHVG